MKPYSVAIWVSALVIGILIGGAVSRYWDQQTRKAESAIALDQANTAAKVGDIDNAIVYAAQSYVLYPESPLARFMLKELTDKRAARIKEADK